VRRNHERLGGNICGSAQQCRGPRGSWVARKALLDKLIARDSKRFEIELAGKANEAIEKIKSELQVQASQTVEKFKSDLQLQAMEHQVRFSRLQKATRKRFPKAIGAIAPVIANPEGRT